MEKSSKIFYKLTDKSEHKHEVDTVVECSNGSVYIMPEGYGDGSSEDGSGCPVMLELWEGELRVVIGGDINQEDPTHIISLNNAKEDVRGVALMTLEELDELRRQKIDHIWEDFDLGLTETQTFDDCEIWKQVSRNKYERKFHYHNRDRIEEGLQEGTFVIIFKSNSTATEDTQVKY